MTVFFLGEEGAHQGAIESGIRTGGSPIFFAPILPEPDSYRLKKIATVIVPAQKFLNLAPLQLPVPVLASGPPSLLTECLAAGCADYLREPWSFDELESRLYRFTGEHWLSLLGGGNWDGSTLSGPAGSHRLSPGLSTLLNLLLSNHGACVSREALSAMLGYSIQNSRSIDMQVSRLRGIFCQLELQTAAQALQASTGGYLFSPGANK